MSNGLSSSATDSVPESEAAESGGVGSPVGGNGAFRQVIVFEAALMETTRVERWYVRSGVCLAYCTLHGYYRTGETAQDGGTNPVQGVEIQVLDLAMVKVARQPDAVVSHVRLLANDDKIVLATAGIELDHLLPVYSRLCWLRSMTHKGAADPIRAR